jgi:hypothetical protein
MELVETAEHWDVPVSDSEVTRVSFDWAVSLLIGSGEATFEVRIEGEILLEDADEAGLTIDPEGDPQQLAPVLSLLRQPVDHVCALKNGELRIGLSSGTTLRVAASDEFEPWEISGPRGMRIVSVPGGNVAVWRAETQEI